MTDPTIPELVALRQAYLAWRHPEGNVEYQETGSAYGAMHDLLTAIDRHLPTLLDALDHVGDANKMVAHSPDGGKVEGPELRRCPIADTGDYYVVCSHCDTETDEVHTWQDCAIELKAALEGDRSKAWKAFSEAQSKLESLTTWRPISEPPSAEVHAWCDGWYLFREPTYDPRPQRIRSRDTWVLFEGGSLTEYLPIPPSDESETP